MFGMPASDYKRFMNFLSTHDCAADFREFRNPTHAFDRRQRQLFPVPSPVTSSPMPGHGDIDMHTPAEIAS